MTARFFEEAIQERSTASSIAVRLGETIPGAPDRAASRVATDHLEAVAWATDDIVAPGNRLSFVVDVALKPGMHVYAPGGPRLPGDPPAPDRTGLPAEP